MKALIILIVLSSGVGFAQSIKGRLLSARDGEPLGSGGISVNGNKAYFQIDLDGRFRMALPDSATQITFLYIGHSSFKMNIPYHKDTTDLGDVYMFVSPITFDLPKSGTLTYKYESGETEIVFSLKRWELEGPYTEFYKNGNKRVEGIYKKGMKTGKWIYHRADGKTVTLTFQDDVLVQ